MKQVLQMAQHQHNDDGASQFFETVLGKDDSKVLSPQAQRENETLMALLESAPGQNLSTTKETVWGAANGFAEKSHLPQLRDVMRLSRRMT
jgi:hypothetical protein